MDRIGWNRLKIGDLMAMVGAVSALVLIATVTFFFQASLSKRRTPGELLE